MKLTKLLYISILVDFNVANYPFCLCFESSSMNKKIAYAHSLSHICVRYYYERYTNQLRQNDGTGNYAFT